MSRPKSYIETATLQIRMPEETVQEIKINALKYNFKTRGEFVVQFYAFAKKNGFLDWIKDYKGDRDFEIGGFTFQVRMPLDIIKSIKMDALNYTINQGKMVYLAYIYAKKHGLSTWAKQ